jgi:hypothetical protein
MFDDQLLEELQQIKGTLPGTDVDMWERADINANVQMREAEIIRRKRAGIWTLGNEVPEE